MNSTTVENRYCDYSRTSGLSHKIRIPTMLTNKYSGNTYSHFIETIFEDYVFPNTYLWALRQFGFYGTDRWSVVSSNKMKWFSMENIDFQGNGGFQFFSCPPLQRLGNAFPGQIPSWMEIEYVMNVLPLPAFYTLTFESSWGGGRKGEGHFSAVHH